MRESKRVGRKWLALCAPLLLGGCAFSVTIPEPTIQAGTGRLEVGAARVDITPIPGIPMGGFSLFGSSSRGVWNRLYARAIYVQDAAGVPLVLVSVDLLQMPNGLADRIALELSTELELGHIGREHLILSATHTHQGPANYFTSPMETSDFSPSSAPGFDQDLFDFLVNRIVQAIRDAEAEKVAADLLVNHANDGDATDNIVTKVFRNRSVTAFQLNSGARDFIGAHASLAGCTLYPEFGPESDPDMCLAVDPNVEILNFVRAGQPDDVIAVAAFLATHPTVLSSKMEVYSGDLFGVTANLLERGTSAGPSCVDGTRPPVVALFNGAAGDVSPAWDEDRRDRDELLDFAEKLRVGICGLLPGAKVTPVAVGRQFRIVDNLKNQTFVASGFQRKTDPRPLPGEAKLGGAEDGRTSFYHAGFQEGVRAPKRGEHGSKKPAVSFIGKLIFWLFPPPHRAPLGIFRLGPIGIASVPGEPTTMLGHRIRDGVRNALGVERVLLAGYTNGHIDYVTTAEEYDAQHFEGASNFYGDSTGPFLTHALAELAANLGGPLNEDLRSTRIYRRASKRTFRPGDAAGPPYRVDDGLSSLIVDRVPNGMRAQPRRDFPAFCFYDAIPRLSPVPDPASPIDCRRTIPRVSVLDDGTDTKVADAAGLDLVTVMVGVARDRMEWCALWLVPEAMRQQTSKHRFRAERIRGADAWSLPFVPDDIFAGKTPFLDRRGGAHLQNPTGSPTYDECKEVPAFP